MTIEDLGFADLRYMSRYIHALLHSSKYPSELTNYVERSMHTIERDLLISSFYLRTFLAFALKNNELDLSEENHVPYLYKRVMLVYIPLQLRLFEGDILFSLGAA